MYMYTLYVCENETQPLQGTLFFIDTVLKELLFQIVLFRRALARVFNTSI